MYKMKQGMVVVETDWAAGRLQEDGASTGRRFVSSLLTNMVCGSHGGGIKGIQIHGCRPQCRKQMRVQRKCSSIENVCVSECE